MQITFHQFIIKTYDETDLLLLCDSHDNFKDAKAEFSQEMSIKEKARRLIDYCEKHGFFDDLWNKVKEERPIPWKEYKMPLEKPTSSVGRMRENLKEAGNVYKELKSIEKMDTQVEPMDGTTSNKTHPLAQDVVELKKWFAESLDTDEQVLFLTAALFSGIEKHEFLSLYDGINQGLQPENSKGQGIE